MEIQIGQKGEFRGNSYTMRHVWTKETHEEERNILNQDRVDHILRRDLNAS